MAKTLFLLVLILAFRLSFIDLQAQTIGTTVLPQHISFPEIHDWKSVRITLERTECFGTCPSYRVEVRGDGDVTYEGRHYVAVRGSHHGWISREKVRELVKAFRDADYYSLLDRYEAEITDMRSYHTVIEIDGRSKEVKDYAGQSVGMPEAVSGLEDAIDRIVDTERWTQGNAATLATLRHEKWDIKSEEAAATLARVAQFGNVDAVRALIAAGVPLHGGEQGQDTVLMRAALSGFPDMIKLLLQYHPDVNEANAHGRTALMRAASPNRYRDEERPYLDIPESTRAETVRLLLAAGADIHARTKDGRTALMEVARDAEIALLLINAGSDVNARDKDGYTPLMLASEADVVQVLLDNGADPTLHNAYGETALDVARRDGKQKVERLLKAIMAAQN